MDRKKLNPRLLEKEKRKTLGVLVEHVYEDARRLRFRASERPLSLTYNAWLNAVSKLIETHNTIKAVADILKEKEEKESF